MKRIVRKMSFLICTALLVTSVSGGAVNSVSAQSENVFFSENNMLLETLGVTQDIEKSEYEMLTRAEFAAMTVRMLNEKPENYKSYFDDVDESDNFASEIAMAKERGFISGISETEFAPDNTITYAQATKMIVSALGCDEFATYEGGYPNGYYRVAYKLDITDNVDYIANDGITFKDAVNMIANALEAPYIGIGGIEFAGKYINFKYEETDDTVMNHYFSYYFKEGVVWSAGEGSMRTTATLKGFDIDGEIYQYDDLNSKRFLGMNVKALYDENKNILLVTPTKKNTVVQVEKDDFSDYKNNKITFFDESGKKHTYSIAKGCTYLKNWRVCSDSVLEPDDGVLTLIDNDGDGEIDVINKEIAEIIYISSIDNGTVYDSNGEMFENKKGIKLSNDIHFIDGTEDKVIDVDDLKVGMILELYFDENNSLVYACASYKVLHGGKVTLLKDDEIYIDNECYKTTAYFRKHYANVTKGNRITALYDSRGRITAVEKYVTTSEEGMQYGYFLNYYKEESGKFMIKLLTAQGDKKDFELKKKIKLDGKTVSSDGSEMEAALKEQDYPKYQVIKYKTSSGAISVIDTFKDAEGENYDDYYNLIWDENDSLTRYVKQKAAIWRGNSFMPYAIWKSTIVFEVPKALSSNPLQSFDESLFRVRTANYVNNDKVTCADFYDLDKNFAAAVMVSYETAGSGDVRGTIDVDDSPVAIIYDSCEVVANDDDELSIEYSCFNGNDINLTVVPGLLEGFKNDNLLPKRGDVIQYSLDTYGQIDGIMRIPFNEETYTWEIDYSNTGTSWLHDTTFIVGKIYSISDSHIAFKPYQQPNTGSYISKPNGIGSESGLYILEKKSSLSVFCFDGKWEGIVQPEEVLTISSVGETEADIVLIELDWGVPTKAVVYKK